MTETAAETKIEFRQFTIDDKPLYDEYLLSGSERGCEFSFANLFLWGNQKFAVVDGCIVIFSQFDRTTVYPFPLGKGDLKPAVDAVIKDAAARGIQCRLTGLTAESKDILNEMYPGRFCFHCDPDNSDYVYSIDDLADLKGRKYHSKKNHLNRFREEYPDAKAEPLTDENIDSVRALIDRWYSNRTEDDPEGDYMMEQSAINKALSNWRDISMESLVLMNDGRAIALTFGSRLAQDTFDVHFEKADSDILGAYAAINCEFANYIREKYPEVRYLNREEDMGIEGLRKAKQSYHPHHMVQKCWAHLTEDGYDY